MHTKSVSSFVSTFFGLWIFSGVCLAQSQMNSGLKDLAAKESVQFGFEISPEILNDQRFRSIISTEANVGTLTMYWYLPGGETIDLDRGRLIESHQTLAADVASLQPQSKSKTKAKSKHEDSGVPHSESMVPIHGVYDFSRPLAVAKFCIDHRIRMHGHTLVYAADRFTPPWVLEQPPAKARSILENHVETVVSTLDKELKLLGGRIDVWQVVNEAFDYQGNLADNYWNRSLGIRNGRGSVPEFIQLAFAAAAKVDPKAKLIYNDYGQEEIDSRKFDGIYRMLKEMCQQRIPIHGMGWQLHVTADQVLDPNFPLEKRMKAIAALGLDNYITELDVVMDARNPDGSLAKAKKKYTQEDLQRQKYAYKKIVEIFKRVQRHKDLIVWGVADSQSWLGAERAPLLFDAKLQKKDSYRGIAEAFLGEISGYRTIRHLLTGGLLQAKIGESVEYEPVQLARDWGWFFGCRFFPGPTTNASTQWLIGLEEADSTRRIQSMLNRRYLNVSGSTLGSDVRTYWSNPDWRSQRWHFIAIPCFPNCYIAVNAWSLMGIAPTLLEGTFSIRSTNRWINTLWVVE